MSLDKYLVEHCAPTLASIKTANLFSCRFDNITLLCDSIFFWNRVFKDKGVELILLRCERGFALVYACRKGRLAADLAKEGVPEFLCEYGYSSTEVGYAVDRLKGRIQSSEGFPHEIGIFLGYPLGDVKGFIENAGANCKCTGCWKVYCNECEAVRLFAKYKKCREVYSRLWNSGARSVEQLTVKA